MRLSKPVLMDARWLGKVAAVSAGLQAGLLLLARACIPLAMCQFGVILPGVGTMHHPARAWGVAAVLQQVTAYAENYHFSNPVLLILVNGAVAWCYNLDKEGWKPIKTSTAGTSKL